MLAYQAYSSKVEVARYGSLFDELIHGKGRVNVDTKIFYRVRNRNGCVVKFEKKSGGKFRELFACTDQNCFCLVIVELKFIVGHPVFYVRVTCRCAIKEDFDILGGVTIIKLGVICVEVVFKRV